MHQPWYPDRGRRGALLMLAALPFGMPARQAVAASRAELRQAEALASAEFTDEHNATHRLGELTRPLLLVNLWASWCAGCLEEMPTIRALIEHFGASAIDVVLLSHDMNWPGDLAYVRTAKLPFRHWKLSSRLADTTVAAAFRIEDDRFGLPQSLVFAGRPRVLVGAHQGARDWAAAEQLRQVQGWLEAAR
jgi:thiol-disulfide isomerase/thioredoxin